jgi:CTP synthase (UTP-ammonia lyase)
VDDRKPGDPKLVHGQIVRALPGTRLFEIMQCEEFPEEYFCNYEVNPAYEARFASAGLSVAARGPNGEIRAVEIKEHRFFFATLFQPQRSSRPEKPHPLIVSLVQAATQFKKERAGAAGTAR